MSRNMRQRITPPPAQKMPLSSPQTSHDSDSDDDYGGVDDISGSEDDEPNVEVAEERAIISSEGEDIPEIPRPYEENGPWEGFDDFNSANLAPLDADLFEQEIQKSSSVDESYDEKTVQKHVHFESPESDSETVDSDPTDWIGDLFMDKNELDPGFLRQIEQDDENGHFSDDGFYYGEGDSDEDAADFDDSSDDSDLSGYDTDESGMTTDVEELPVKYVAPKQSVLRTTPEASSSSEEVPRRRIHRKPALGSWTHNTDTPYAIVDINSTKVKVFNMHGFRQRMRNQSTTASPSNTPQQSFSVLQSSPMISNSGNIMMSAMMSDPFIDNGMTGQMVGPPEAYYPWTSVDVNGTYATHDSSSIAGSDDFDDEDLWNINDMIDFGDNPSDEDELEPSDEAPTGAEDATGAPSSTPARPTTARSEDQVHPLLDHFSNGTVGSFRFNQHRHQLLNRASVTRDSLAFGSSHMEGTIRGVKAGRLQHANTPITPVRKKKRQIALDSSPASPTPYAHLEKKRKFHQDDQHSGLKRRRAI